MRKIVRAAAVPLALATLFASGCMDMDNEVFVRKDGSGTLTTIAAINAGPMGGPKTELDEDALKQAVAQARAGAEMQAKNMGEGVEVEAVELTKDAPPKLRIVFKFADINRFNAKAGGETDDKPAFRYADGVLTINNKDTEDMLEKIIEPDEMPEEMMAALPGILPNIGDSKMRLRVRVDGVIGETNAKMADKAKSTVTLLDLPVKPVMEAMVNKRAELAAIDEIDGEEAQVAALAKIIPGLKLETAKTVTIAFK